VWIMWHRKTCGMNCIRRCKINKRKSRGDVSHEMSVVILVEVEIQPVLVAQWAKPLLSRPQCLLA